MIHFNQVTWQNFLSYGNAPTTFNFNEGINKLSGLNGAGKSTIVDAIYFALFGKTYRNINLSQLVNSINKKDLLVTLDFKINSDTYRIDRGIKPTVFRIFKNGTEDKDIIPLESKSKSYQQLLEEDILRFNSNLLEQTSIKSLTKSMSFLTLPKATRREIIENVLDIKIFSIMNKKAKDKADDLEKEIVGIKKDIQNIELLIVNEKDSLQRLEALKEEQSAKRSAKIEQLQSQIVELEKDSEEKRSAIKRLEKEKDNKKKLQTELSEKESELKLLKDSMFVETQNITKASDDRIEAIKKQMNDLKTAWTDERDKIVRELTDNKDKNISTNTTTKNEKLFNLKNEFETKQRNDGDELSSVTNQINILKNKVKFLKETCGDCPNISKMVQEGNPDGLLETKKALELSLEEDKVTYNTTRKAIEAEFDSFVSQLKNNTEEAITTRKTECQTKVSDLETKTNALIETKRKETQSKVEAATKELSDKIEAIDRTMNVLKQDINKCDTYINMIAGVENQIVYNDKMIGQYNTDIKSEQTSDIVIDDSKYRSYELQKSSLTEEYDNKTNDKMHYVYARKLLSEENIKAYVVKKYLPAINALLKTYLQKFGSDVNIIFDEEFEMVSIARHKESFSYESHSSGQQRIIDLAILFMFINFCKYKYPQASTNILIMDEISAMLDATNENTYFELVKQIAATENKSIIAISHSGNIESDKVDYNYNIELSKGFSKLILKEG